MKKLLLTLGLSVALVGSAQANSNLALELAKMDLLQNVAATPANLINWKVGEFTESKVNANGFGDVGTIKKTAGPEQGNAIWVVNQTAGQMGSQKVEILLDRANGQVLEYRENGTKKDIPNDKIEIISQDQARITVPAGTFDTIHIVAKSAKAKSIEMWANPRDTALDGGVQMKVDTGMIAMTVQLTKFGGK